jgi:tetratricopeptide (TPR) repeat protein
MKTQKQPVQPVASPTPSSRQMTVQQALELADQHRKAGRAAQSENVLRQLLSQKPDQPEALHALAIIAHENGKTAQAVQLIERAIAVKPQVALYQSNIAEMYRLIGQPQKAVEHGKIALGLRPSHADTYNNLGIAHFDLGDFESAVKNYETAIRLKPNFPEACSNLGNALRQLKRYAEAEASYRKSIELRPSYAEAHNNLGSVLRDMERFEDAEQSYLKAVSLRPGYVEAMCNLVLAYKDLKKFDEGLALVDKILRLRPDCADAYCYAGAIQIELKNGEKALGLINKAMSFEPNKAETLNMLGRAWFECANPEKAVESYQRAIALKPTLADSYNNMGNALKELGRFDEALAAFNKTLELTPDAYGAYVNLVDTKKFTSSDDPHLKAMEAYKSEFGKLAEEREMHLRFALSKAYDDLKRHDDAFENMKRGCELKRKTIKYDEREILGYFDRIKQQITKEVIQKQSGHGVAGDLPIFVLGMPRSGTTLVEQIISSHPRVKAAGELRDLNETLSSVRDSKGNIAPYPEFVPVLKGGEVAKIADVYLRRLAKHGPMAERITDKMPSNFYFTGMIHLAMPNAKIIHTNRNPVDTCLSCFSKLFAGEQNQTYDLAELGRYYRAYHGLMQHWREVLPAGSFLDVQYEEVVADTEGQARRILEYCGLEWDPRVLNFHKNDRPVKTASASQVRKPIYSSSVARWRNYEKHLTPLLQELGDLVR